MSRYTPPKQTQPQPAPAVPPVRRVLCIGAGYVGGPSMAVLAQHNPHTRFRVVDLDAARIRLWQAGPLPIYEPGLDAVLGQVRGRNLHFETPSAEAYAWAEMIFVCVHTPTKNYGEGAGLRADLQHWERCAREIAQHSRGAIVVEKSTVPLGAAQALERILGAGRGPEGRFCVLSNPEFLAEGTAVADLQHPARVLLGGPQTPGGRRALAALRALYTSWVPKARILATNVWSSELAKLLANAMLAQRISSINAITALCERSGAHVGDLARAIGMDPRIGRHFLEAGLGFGGSCFHKDLLNLVYLLRHQGLGAEAEYWQQVVHLNTHQTRRFASTVVEAQFHSVAGKRIAVLGFAFKPHTNDVRETPALPLCRALHSEGAQLAIHDPQALENARWALQDLQDSPNPPCFVPDPLRAAQNAHAIVLATHWPEYAQLDYAQLFRQMQKPAFLFDGRLLLNAKKLHRLGFNVYPIGSPPLTHF